jgi:phosphoribosylformimino-5-aminoimidazole carboxamide ribotide isomerase
MWQRISNEEITPGLLDYLSDYCAEFLIHAADVEGKQMGVEIPLIEKLGKWAHIPVTYAGGVRSIADLDLIYEAGEGRLDATVGSALDIFGGNLIYKDIVIRSVGIFYTFKEIQFFLNTTSKYLKSSYY